jgi:hypothetical protein
MARRAVMENEVLGYCEVLRHAESRVSRFRRGLSRHVLRAQARFLSFAECSIHMIEIEL